MNRDVRLERKKCWDKPLNHYPNKISSTMLKYVWLFDKWLFFQCFLYEAWLLQYIFHFIRFFLISIFGLKFIQILSFVSKWITTKSCVHRVYWWQITVSIILNSIEPTTNYYSVEFIIFPASNWLIHTFYCKANVFM